MRARRSKQRGLSGQGGVGGARRGDSRRSIGGWLALSGGRRSVSGVLVAVAVDQGLELCRALWAQVGRVAVVHVRNVTLERGARGKGARAHVAPVRLEAEVDSEFVRVEVRLLTEAVVARPALERAQVLMCGKVSLHFHRAHALSSRQSARHRASRTPNLSKGRTLRSDDWCARYEHSVHECCCARRRGAAGTERGRPRAGGGNGELVCDGPPSQGRSAPGTEGA